MGSFVPPSGSALEGLANLSPLSPQNQIASQQAATQAAESRARIPFIQAETEAQTQRTALLKQQQADANVRMQIYADPKLNGDPDAMIRAAATGQYGQMSGLGFSALLQEQRELAQTRLQNTDAQNKLDAANYNKAGDIIDAINKQQKTDPNAAQTSYQAQLPYLRQLAPKANWAPQYDPQQGDFMIDWLGHRGAVLGQQKTETENAAQQLDIDTKKRAQAAQDLGTVTDQPSLNLWNQKYKGLVPNAPVTYDPDKVATLQKSLGVPVAEQPKFDLDRAKLRMGVFGDSEFDMFLGKNAGQFKNADGTPKTAAQLTGPEFNSLLGNYAQVKQDPVMRDMAIASKGLQEAMLRVQTDLNPTPEDIHMLAQNMVNHTMAPSQFSEIKARGTASGAGLKIVTEAQRIDPNFSMERADAEYNAMKQTETKFTSGKEADLVRSNNVAMEHLGMLDQARQAMANGNFQVLNYLANGLGVQAGHDAKTTFDAIAQRVSQEVNGAYIAGGGGELERISGSNQFSSKMSDQQLRSNIGATFSMMDSQQRALQDQYRRGTYGQGTQADNLFTPGARSAHDRVLQNARGTTGGNLTTGQSNAGGNAGGNTGSQGGGNVTHRYNPATGKIEAL